MPGSPKKRAKRQQKAANLPMVVPQPIFRRGRPSEYDPAYCEDVIEHMAQGASLTSFAASVGVDRKTIYNWQKAHPDFLLACARAQAACAAWWEQANRLLAITGMGNQGAIAFGLKNMAHEDWKDKVEQHITGSVEHTLSREQLEERIRAKLSELKRLQSPTEDTDNG